MDDRAARDLAAIKARAEQVRFAIEAGCPEVDMQGFHIGQLGLSLGVVDRFGRLWFAEGDKLILASERRRSGK